VVELRNLGKRADGLREVEDREVVGVGCTVNDGGSWIKKPPITYMAISRKEERPQTKY
jgi:hypothetical protein